MQSLNLVRQTKLHHLLPGCDKHSRLEASGVAVKNDRLYVIFDDIGRIAFIEQTFALDGDHRWLIETLESPGFEDIAYSEERDCFFALIESTETDPGAYRGEVVEFDAELNLVSRQRLPFELESGNKGFEGLVFMRRDTGDHLLALCEGNSCKSGAEGRRPGNGRIQIFRDEDGQWVHIDTLPVPATAHFIDYSSMDIRDDRVVILSQESSQLWVGTLAPSAWEFQNAGVVYQLPRHPSGAPRYCNAEGVAWISPTQVVITSDRKKPGSKHCGHHDQSIHVFDLPEM